MQPEQEKKLCEMKNSGMRKGGCCGLSGQAFFASNQVGKMGALIWITFLLRKQELVRDSQEKKQPVQCQRADKLQRLKSGYV